MSLAQPSKPCLAARIQTHGHFLESLRLAALADIQLERPEQATESIDRLLAVHGSEALIPLVAEARGLDEIFKAAGAEWREPGCSMCLAMNPDKLQGREVCASSSNRNFKGRQGSPTGRTLLMSPAMVAAAAVAGEVTDVRELIN